MEALGPLLVVLSLPLLFRLVPPNYLYGFRTPATLRNRSVWYDANALCAKHLVALGLCMVILELTLPVNLRIRTLQIIFVAGMAIITVADWRTASRWARERVARIV